MSKFLSCKYQNLEAYVPGEQPQDMEYIKLNTNESPYPPSKEVIDAISSSEVEKLRLYSDPECKCLRESLAKHYNTGYKNVFVSNGSDDILNFAFMAFSQNGVIFPEISYGFYSVFADLHGIEYTQVPLMADFTINSSDYTGKNAMVVIANPNAPTGKNLTVDQIEEILVNNKYNVVVIDEAYAAFSGYSCAQLLPKYDNLVIVGTFSKSRGMAGARLGYIITSEEIASDLEKVKFSINPYNVNCLTQAAGASVLENNDYYLSRISEVCDTRDKFSDNLVKLGFEVLPSKANFVFAKHATVSGKTIFEELKNKKILIRRFDKERIDEYLRISIGTPEQMDTVTDAIAEIVGGKI